MRAAAAGLLKRDEENKILIVLSDGRPNDIVVNRPNSRNPRPYFGDYGTKDTAMEVRHLRNAGVSVLGVFTGEEGIFRRSGEFSAKILPISAELIIFRQ